MADKTNAKGSKRAHRATYAKDKRKGGYLVRVAGPHSNMFAGREVPVTMKDGTEQKEKLDGLIWSGKDKETGEPVTLYSFVAKPKETVDAEF
jgi:hypothetical protein